MADLLWSVEWLIGDSCGWIPAGLGRLSTPPLVDGEEAEVSCGVEAETPSLGVLVSPVWLMVFTLAINNSAWASCCRP